MDIKKDIANRENIDFFLRQFYAKVVRDETIGIIFTKIIPINWDKHIPLITDFGETILLDNHLYKDNAMAKHFAIKQIYPLKKTHF
ncbi:MAG: group III truncated hemoglobin, partial [Ferruginibacter sp.]